PVAANRPNTVRRAAALALRLREPRHGYVLPRRTVEMKGMRSTVGSNPEVTGRVAADVAPTDRERSSVDRGPGASIPKVEPLAESKDLIRRSGPDIDEVVVSVGGERRPSRAIPVERDARGADGPHIVA